MKKTTKIFVFVFIAILVITGIGGYYFLTKKNTKKEIKTIQTERRKIEKQLEVAGKIMALKSQGLVWNVGDVVEKIGVSLGEDVKKDKVLVEFENGRELKAPFDGRIVEINTYVGEEMTSGGNASPGAGQTLITIADMGTLKFVAEVDEDQIKDIAKDQAIHLSCDVAKDLELEAKVEDVPLKTKEKVDGSRYFEIQSAVTDLKGLYPREGIGCDGSLVTEVKENVLSLPAEAILFEDGKTSVYIYRSLEDIEKKEIAAGIDDTVYYEVKKGLSEGDTVVEKADQYSKEK